ncbi:MAG: exo-alpha-sialidase [Thermomicrobiales bacterium]|nr:exo-alpha-sialidase [Thermomicrobiales bacterium]
MPLSGAVHELVIAPGPYQGGSIRNSEASIIELNDGRLLLAWSDWYGGPSDFDNCRISGKTSADGGRTWSEPFLLQDHDGAISVDSPAFIRLQSGAILLCYCRQVPSRMEPDRRSGDVFQCVRRSEDEGRTWSDPLAITNDEVRQFMIHDNGIQLRSGRIVLPIAWTNSHETPRHSYCALAWYSDDDGVSWKRGRGQVTLPKRGAMEPTIVEREDGSILMLIRTQLGYLYRAESNDGGDTWSPAHSTGIVGSESPVNIKRFHHTDDLLMIWNHCNDPGLSHGGRSPLTAAISRDEGATWESFRNLETDHAHTYSYPSITFRGDEVLVTYYRSLHGPEPDGSRNPSERHDAPEVEPDVSAALGRELAYELKLQILPAGWFYGTVAQGARR